MDVVIVDRENRSIVCFQIRVFPSQNRAIVPSNWTAQSIIEYEVSRKDPEFV